MLHKVSHNYYDQRQQDQGQLKVWFIFLWELILFWFVNHMSRLSSHLSTSRPLCCSQTLVFLTGRWCHYGDDKAIVRDGDGCWCPGGLFSIWQEMKKILCAQEKQTLATSKVNQPDMHFGFTITVLICLYNISILTWILGPQHILHMGRISKTDWWTASSHPVVFWWVYQGNMLP